MVRARATNIPVLRVPSPESSLKHRGPHRCRSGFLVTMSPWLHVLVGQEVSQPVGSRSGLETSGPWTMPACRQVCRGTLLPGNRSTVIPSSRRTCKLVSTSPPRPGAVNVLASHTCLPWHMLTGYQSCSARSPTFSAHERSHQLPCFHASLFLRAHVFIAYHQPGARSSSSVPCASVPMFPCIPFAPFTWHRSRTEYTLRSSHPHLWRLSYMFHGLPVPLWHWRQSLASSIRYIIGWHLFPRLPVDMDPVESEFPCFSRSSDAPAPSDHCGLVNRLLGPMLPCAHVST
jgi:hypothetical protein